ncbi:hypothetical protein ANN_14060 [Periplaneta americana]|uniref:Uncharacterized protein n=1 Tax=Periplaneta americana TaxID=6978 RepID=A0ABQ8SWM2_PERAM|nr:hypothetical protein ANN_14060 [Periplaneta americana]
MILSTNIPVKKLSDPHFRVFLQKFSRYNNCLSDRRRRFSFDNLREYIVVYCNAGNCINDDEDCTCKTPLSIPLSEATIVLLPFPVTFEGGETGTPNFSAIERDTFRSPLTLTLCNACAKLVPNIKFINDSSVICCENFDVNISETTENVTVCEALKDFADSNNKIDIRLVMYILQQKDVIINELREKNDILRKHNDLLSSVHYKNGEAYKMTTVSEVPSARSQEMLINSENTSKNKSAKFIKKTTSDSAAASKYDNNIDQENVVQKVAERQQHVLPHSNQSKVANELWTDVVKRKHRNHHKLVGKKPMKGPDHQPAAGPTLTTCRSKDRGSVERHGTDAAYRLLNYGLATAIFADDHRWRSSLGFCPVDLNVHGFLTAINVNERRWARRTSTDRLDTATCTHTLLSTDVHIRTDHVRYTLRYLHCFSVVSCPHPSDSALNGILENDDRITAV